MGNQVSIPIFEAMVDEDGLGLFGISYVDQPAIMEQLVAFRDTGQKVYFSSNEKQEIVSPLAIPEQLIFRMTDDGIPYYIKMSEETIRTMAQKYLASGDWNQWTFMHENMDASMDERLQDGIYMKKMWIIEDPETDEANVKYGFSLPKGTLMVHAKVDNAEIWQKIRSGEIKGLSLEAFFRLKNVNKALQITYSRMKTNLELFQKFIAFLNEISVEAEDIASEAKKDETDSGSIELKYYLDDEHYLTVDGEGIVRDENMKPVDDGEYRLADSNVLVVDNGRFVETKTVAEDENKVEAQVAETFEEEKEDEKAEGEDEKAEGEDDPEAGEPDDKGDDVVDEEGDGDGKEEDGEDEKPLVNAIPYSIGGTEYLLPPEVVDFIESLIASKVEVEEKLTKMEEQTPSAQPVGKVVKTPVEEGVDINGRVSVFSSFKGFGHRP